MVGARIKNYLVANGIKQTFLAEKSGLSVPIIYDICNSNRRIDVVEYAKICEVLNRPLEYFLTDNAEKGE